MKDIFVIKHVDGIYESGNIYFDKYGNEIKREMTPNPNIEKPDYTYNKLTPEELATVLKRIKDIPVTDWAPVMALPPRLGTIDEEDWKKWQAELEEQIRQESFNKLLPIFDKIVDINIDEKYIAEFFNGNGFSLRDLLWVLERQEKITIDEWLSLGILGKREE